MWNWSSTSVFNPDLYLNISAANELTKGTSIHFDWIWKRGVWFDVTLILNECHVSFTVWDVLHIWLHLKLCKSMVFRQTTRFSNWTREQHNLAFRLQDLSAWIILAVDHISSKWQSLLRYTYSRRFLNRNYSRKQHLSLSCIRDISLSLSISTPPHPSPLSDSVPRI